jgi:hypothetical protein
MDDVVYDIELYATSISEPNKAIKLTGNVKKLNGDFILVFHATFYIGGYELPDTITLHCKKQSITHLPKPIHNQGSLGNY